MSTTIELLKEIKKIKNAVEGPENESRIYKLDLENAEINKETGEVQFTKEYIDETKTFFVETSIDPEDGKELISFSVVTLKDLHVTGLSIRRRCNQGMKHYMSTFGLYEELKDEEPSEQIFLDYKELFINLNRIVL